MVLLTPADAGLEGEDSYVVMQDGAPTLSATAGSSQLFVDTTINDIPVKSVLLKERAEEYTLEEYADIAGVSVDDEDGPKAGAPFPASVIKNAPGGPKKFGIHINREGATYKKSTYFEGYPAKRPWYPFTNELYQNVIPSAAAGYPYKAKALFLIKGTPVLASPAGHKQIEMLRDPKNIPLFIACDVTIGETSMYADYIIPNLTYLERWGTPHVPVDVNNKFSKIRQPAGPPKTEIVTVDGQDMPISMEAFLIAVGKKLGLGEGGYTIQ